MALFGIVITTSKRLASDSLELIDFGAFMERRRITKDVEAWIEGEGREDIIDVINPKCSCEDCKTCG